MFGEAFVVKNHIDINLNLVVMKMNIILSDPVIIKDKAIPAKHFSFVVIGSSQIMRYDDVMVWCGNLVTIDCVNDIIVT